MRVLFLDVDGVLNRTGFRPRTSLGLRSWIEPELALQLNEVLGTTGAKIVLSSDWRLGRELSALREELLAAGILDLLVGVTPVVGGARRWHEIQTWIDENGLRLEDIVIIDDMFDMGPLEDRFVRTSPLSGMDPKAAEAIVGLFNAEQLTPADS